MTEKNKMQSGSGKKRETQSGGGFDLEKTIDAFSDPEICRPLLDRLGRETKNPLRFMEVCGTHTVSIFRSGLRGLLPPLVTHLSGPGCPVCVTHEREVAAYMELSGRPGVILACFGDLMRVPGPGGLSLKDARASGARVEVVYSPQNALNLAAQTPSDQVVFVGIGFETTAPAVAAAVLMARSAGLGNFSVLSLHKLVPPALFALLGEEDGHIDVFLLPGHVSTVIGLKPYSFLPERFRKSAAVGGFEPSDIIQSLLMLNAQREREPAVLNQYVRAVSPDGNPRAREIMNRVFEPADALWRGLGLIPRSGLRPRGEYSEFDAWKRFSLDLPEAAAIKGCRCGAVLRGKIAPPECPLFGKACTPAKPVGPCMVSTEGSCAAYFKYRI